MSNRKINDENSGCGRKADLAAYIYGECTPDEERSFKMHMNECAVCKSEAAEFLDVRKSMQAWEINSAPRLNLNLAAERNAPRSLREIFSELAAALPGWFKYGTAVAAACSLILLLLAVLNTQIQYGQNGFSVQMALFSSKPDVKGQDSEAIRRDAESAARTMVAKVVEEKETQIRRDLEMQISELDRQLSAKNTAALSRVALELKSEQRERLQRALSEFEVLRKQRQLEDDPFNLWSGVNDGRYNGRNADNMLVGSN